MTEMRLADIALLSIENDFSDKISLDDLVADFGGQDKNNNDYYTMVSYHLSINHKLIDLIPCLL